VAQSSVLKPGRSIRLDAATLLSTPLCSTQLRGKETEADTKAEEEHWAKERGKKRLDRQKEAERKGKAAPGDDLDSAFAPARRDTNHLEHLRSSQGSRAASQRSKSTPKASKKGATSKEKMQGDAPASAKASFDVQAKRIGKLERQLASLRVAGIRLTAIDIGSSDEDEDDENW
jgi:hypothetical protein